MKLFEDGRFPLFAGPCVVEGRDVTLRIAERLKALTAKRPIHLVFKASFDKANRTSLKSFRGPGEEEALAILQDVRRELDLPVHTDVHETIQVPRLVDAVDSLQIPAFLCRQTDLIRAVAATGKPCLLKKGQFVAPEDMGHAAEKFRSVSGHGEITIGERGTFFGYGNLVVDFRSLPILRQYAPVTFDGTHSVQRPSGRGASSGGDREMIPYLVRAAAAVGIDALFLETHEDPSKALSDGPNMVPLDQLAALLDQVEAVRAAVGGA